VSFSRLSSGTKLASKTQKKFKKVPVSDLGPVLRGQKQLKKFSKNRQDVFSTRYHYLTLYPMILMAKP
jgi:hypothetical protein